MSDDASLAITFEIVSLFPEVFDGFLTASLLGKSIAAGRVAVFRTNPRDFAPGRHRSVDDTPCGGGPGMILRPEPLADALDAITAARGPAHKILLSPQGRPLDQAKVEELAGRPRLALVCGRYEGFDARVGEILCDEEIGIGDYVLAGGELAAAVIIEAVARLIPGVLGCGMSTMDESFSRGRLEYPQWTRPLDFRGHTVPSVLLSGDHAAIDRWRRRESFRRTAERRPDLLATYPPTGDELKWQAEGDAPVRARGPRPRRSGRAGRTTFSCDWGKLVVVMPIENQIAEMLKDAMRSRDSATADCLRMIKTKHMERRTASGFKGALDDALWLDVIASYQKQLRKTREEYVAVGDRGAAALPQIDFEIGLCGRFLPKAASDEEVLTAVRETIARLGAPDVKQSGRIVGEIMKANKGKFDPSTVKRLVEHELGAAKP